MRERTAVVVGGGLAGLASAVGLARSGWHTRILERRPATGEVGAGLALPRNGVAALNTLGIEEEVVDQAGLRTLATGFVDTLGRRILTLPDTDPRVRRATTIWGFHRQALHALLHRAALREGVELVDGARVTHVSAGRPGGEPAVVRWQRDDGEHETEAGLVVGADGMWSAVRGSLHPGVSPRYSGSTSWRALLPVSALEGTGLDGRLVEYWGPGAEFGVMRVSADQVYWYGYVRQPERTVFDDELATARAYFADWAPEVVALISATTPDQLMRHDVHHLPDGPERYDRGRVVLVGDAAHGALPTMGQGAATAMEDGATLGRLAGPAHEGDLGRALAEFDALRRPRCQAIAKQARLIARVGADLGGGWRQGLRNAAFRLIPASRLVVMARGAVEWTPPEPLAPA
ncbi:FAD-dependent monooxygenase [Nocardiopsis prasina]|uniref:FAD-dependent monooxygenase n=1 Tax=Nocardiopsis prasina TaxID=2015 RepID=UPI00034A55A2|nr:FAD-dependent monooxygenase [Nocardiopsis prasina]